MPEILKAGLGKILYVLITLFMIYALIITPKVIVPIINEIPLNCTKEGFAEVGLPIDIESLYYCTNVGEQYCESAGSKFNNWTGNSTNTTTYDIGR